MISDGIDALSKHLSRRLQSIPTDFTLTASDRRLLDLVAFLLMHGKLAGDVKSIVLSRRLRLRRLPVHRDYFLRTLLVVDASISRRTMSLWNVEQLLAPADVDLAAYVDGNQREVRLKTSIISLILRR